MLHLDVKRLARFNQPGHRVRGNAAALGFDISPADLRADQSAPASSSRASLSYKSIACTSSAIFTCSSAVCAT